MPACPLKSPNRTRKSLALLGKSQSILKKGTHTCRDVQENTTQKEDLEYSITLRHAASLQCEAASVHDLNDRLENETVNKYFYASKDWG